MTVSKSKSTGRRRLMRLGDYIEEKSENRAWRKYFRMDHWFQNVDKVMRQTLGLRKGDPVPINGGCGTAACMFGHIPNIPMFRRLGVDTVLHNDMVGGVRFTFKGEIILASDLGIELFGISEDRFDSIFVDYGRRVLTFVTPKQAVAKLRKIVAEIDTEEGWKF